MPKRNTKNMLYLQQSPAQILQEIKTFWLLISIYNIYRKQTPTKIDKGNVNVQQNNQQINNPQILF